MKSKPFSFASDLNSRRPFQVRRRFQRVKPILLIVAVFFVLQRILMSSASSPTQDTPPRLSYDLSYFKADVRTFLAALRFLAEP